MTHTAPTVIIDPTSALFFSTKLGTCILQLITSTTEITETHKNEKKKKTKQDMQNYK